MQHAVEIPPVGTPDMNEVGIQDGPVFLVPVHRCLLYTSDAADERSSVDLGGRRIIKKKITHKQ